MATIKGTKWNDTLNGTSKSDKIDGKRGSDLIYGNGGNDKIDGDDGNDIIVGGAGKDEINGGRGFDTAVFSGSFFDYSIFEKGRCDDRVIVSDTVAGRDGTDTLKHVEALQFNDVTIYLDHNNAAVTRADAAATDEDSPVVINVLGNDVDFEGNALTITHIGGQAISVGGSVVLGNGAVVTLNANQTLTYDPSGAFQSLDGGEQGLDSFTYTVTDSHGAASAPTAVNVAVNGLWEQPTYIADGFIDESAQKPDTNSNPLDDQMIVGSGIPASHFGLVQAEDAGIELGLQVIYRQGPTVTTADDYADGVLHFSVNDGAQSTVNGSSVNNAARAAWSFEYSIATGLNGETTDLDSFQFKLLIDLDKGAGTNYLELQLEPETTAQGAGQSGYQWQIPDSLLPAPIQDDAGNSQVTQNSQNYQFYESLITGGTYSQANGFAGPAQFDIVLQAFDMSNTLVAQNHISVDVIL